MIETATVSYALSDSVRHRTIGPARWYVREHLVDRLDKAGAAGTTIFRVIRDEPSEMLVFYAIRGPEAVKYGLSFRKHRKGAPA